MTELSAINPLTLLTSCVIIGGLPLINWISRLMMGQKLSEVGTGNMSVAAAFQQGGKGIGILAALSEALKGVAVVLLARSLFPDAPYWEIVALIALVMGRYTFSRGAGATNVAWGILVHDPVTTGIVLALGGLGYGITRQRQWVKYGILVVFPLVLALRFPGEWIRVGYAIALSVLLAIIYYLLPDDLERKIIILDQSLDSDRVGQKAATLSDLKQAGYPVAEGWVLLKGENPQPLLETLNPAEDNPLIARSSAVGEDQMGASAAGQYETFANLTTQAELQEGIDQCFESYDQPSAVKYREDRGIDSDAMSVLIQKQVKGKISGVAFSRDPVTQQAGAVLVEALPGGADQVVSGEETPEEYRVFIQNLEDIQAKQTEDSPPWLLPDDVDLEIEGEGDLPPKLIQKVAFLTRHIEKHYHGIPQDIEWTYDGEKLWLLQSRPITTLLPIWTRKIASEVIPGQIKPLTWSINQPLTCGVWGDIFTLVLRGRASGLDFDQTATLHYSRAYFNASLLGEIFQRMGLPPESLEYLTLGGSFTPPPVTSTLRNLPGLLRLLNRELKLEQDFQRDTQTCFIPTLEQLQQQSPHELSETELLQRIDTIIAALKPGTYYSILFPLSVSLRKALFQIEDEEINSSQAPEIASLRKLQQLAKQARPLLSENTDSPLEALSQTPEGQDILSQFDQIIEEFGYLSEVANALAVPTWKEDPHPAKSLFTQFLQQSPPQKEDKEITPKGKLIQNRVDLNGQVTIRYSQLMAQLRWTFLELEQRWLDKEILSQRGDIFFLEFAEVRELVENKEIEDIKEKIEERRDRADTHRQLKQVPSLVYGNEAPPPSTVKPEISNAQTLQGIGASAGQAEGIVKVIRDWQNLPDINQDTILVVPYTDSGWAAILARAGGLISEVGGRLSHGAIVAREYGIPAVMDIDNATEQFQDGQRVKLDGRGGVVEILTAEE
jgi:phosphoenolpyruvate synthase/pyruvate phosphate dikinase/glycerol-3-phosphate acyltransferase PlsY